jgi:hypothetical protein
MPAQPGWLARVPEILDILAASPPFLDRPALEHLFRLSRRQAIRLMHVAGGYQIGKTYLVDRAGLVRHLEQLRSTGGVSRARHRKHQISAALREAERNQLAHRVQIPRPTQQAESAPAANQPAAIERPAARQLTIRYADATDLLAQIVDLASRAATDFSAFREEFE